jgi:hypothetical protein
MAVMLGCAVLLIIAPAAFAQTGSISGTVTEFGPKKGPLQGISVKAYSFEGGPALGSATTDANGRYQVKGLAMLAYKVEFSGAGFVTQFYLEKSSFLEATLVSVMEGRNTPEINAALKESVPRPPVNNVPPVLSGTPALGQTLSCSSGIWTGAEPFTFTYGWLREGSPISAATGNTYVVQPADQGRGVACQVTAKNVASTATATSNTLNVPPPPPPPPSPPPPPPPPLSSITGVSQSNSRWREGNRLATFSRSRKPPVGTTFRFVLNQRSTVNFDFTQEVAGRRVNGKCVAQTKANGRKPGCKRTVTQGALTFVGRSGVNKIAFQGRISRSKKLPLGAYTLQITALNSGGKRSSPRMLSFSIVR